MHTLNILCAHISCHQSSARGFSDGVLLSVSEMIVCVLLATHWTNPSCARRVIVPVCACPPMEIVRQELYVNAVEFEM